jgi:hypothetical protein
VNQSLPRVGSFSGNVEAPAELELRSKNNRMLSEVLAVMNVHGFDKDALVFSDSYHMSEVNDYLYTKRRPIDIEAAVGREGN